MVFRRTWLLPAASFVVLLAVLEVSAAPCFQTLESDVDESDAEKAEWIVEVATTELQNLIRSSYDLEIDFLRRSLDVEEEELGKARVFAKSVARRQLRSFEKSFRENLLPMVATIDGATFTINEKRFTFDGEKEEAVSYLDIEIRLDRDEGWGIIRVVRGSNASVSSFESDESSTPSFEGSEAYRKSLAAFSEQQLASVEQDRVQTRMKSIQQAVAVLIGEKLHLDDEQMVEMNAWVEKQLGKLEIDVDQDLFTQVGTAITEKALALEAPPFLNDVQKRAWRLLKNNPMPLGF